MLRILTVAALGALAACGGGGDGAAPAPVKVKHATLAITGVRVFDGDKVIPRADVVIDGPTIVAVGKVAVPAGVPVIDGTGQTLLPGLIDAHVHLQDAAQLEQALVFGVTTVLDMFSVPALVKQIKATDKPDRAELRSAGILATAPGGHGTEYGFEIPTLTEPGQAAAFVDARLAEGSDYIKIVYDDGSAFGMKLPSIDAATMRAVVEAAHARKKLAVVHIGDQDEARAAIESGADGIIHMFQDSTPAADFGAVVAKHHAFVTPTLTVLRTVRGGTADIGGDALVAPYLDGASKSNLTVGSPIRAKTTAGAIEAALAQLVAAKVPILVGTDAPNPGTTFGASVHDELALQVAAGVPPALALAGATAQAARIFGLTDRGRIAPGQRADLVLVDGDPTTTITDSRKIAGIWRGGVRLDREAIKARVAAAPKTATGPIGPISNFDDGTTATKFGQAWVDSTDQMMGGKSTVTLAVQDGALLIRGEVAAGGSSWAGALFSPGPGEFAPADLSSKPRLEFTARGDGKEHVVMVFAEHLGGRPATRTFRAGKKPAPVAFTWKDFGVDGKDILAIFIGHVAPGPFQLAIDNVALK